jgi:hypothetical protein
LPQKIEKPDLRARERLRRIIGRSGKLMTNDKFNPHYFEEL